jgi:hypothetical protein
LVNRVRRARSATLRPVQGSASKAASKSALAQGCFDEHREVSDKAR